MIRSQVQVSPLLPVLFATSAGLFVFLPKFGYSVSAKSASLKCTSSGLVRMTGPGHHFESPSWPLSRSTHTIFLVHLINLEKVLSPQPDIVIYLIPVRQSWKQDRIREPRNHQTTLCKVFSPANLGPGMFARGERTTAKKHSPSQKPKSIHRSHVEVVILTS